LSLRDNSFFRHDKQSQVTDMEPLKEHRYMRISELAKRSGVPRTTIHFYLREGLLHPPVKTGKTMAYYDQSHLSRLDLIQKAKREKRVSTAWLKNWLRQTEGSKDQKPAEAHISAQAALAEGLKNQRRDRILEAAVQVFSRKGFHFTSIRDITRAAGISTGTFYLYFADKNQLFIEVIDKLFRSLREQADAACEKEPDHEKKMMIRGRLFFRFFKNFGEVLYQVRAATMEDSALGEKVRVMYRRLLEPVIEQIKVESEKGSIRKTDSDLLAYALVGLAAIMSLRLNFDNRYSEDEIINFLYDFLLKGVKPAREPR